MKCQRILVPTDLSRYGEMAAREALLHLAAKGKLLLINVVKPAFLVGDELGLPTYDPDATKRRMAQAAVRLQRLAKKLGPRVLTKVVSETSLAETLAVEALRFKAQLVVLSTHGPSGLNRLFMGSVAQKLLRLYWGPVVMLRAGARNCFL